MDIFSRFFYNTKGKFLKYSLLATLLSFTMTLAAEDIELLILQTTDVHGSQAFPQIGTIVERERKNDPDLLLIDCGDMVRGSFEAFQDGGAAMVALMNQLKYDIWVPGNHEFRVGQKLLKRNIDFFSSGDVLAANLRFDDPAIAPERKIVPWKILTRKGLKIAVIGIVSPYYDRWFNYPAYNNLTLRSPAEVMEEVMKQIRAEKPDVVIVAAHLGDKLPVESAPDEWVPFAEILKKYPDVSLLLAGHTHQVIPATSLTHNLWVVQPPIHGKGIAKIKLIYDKSNKKVSRVTSEFINSQDVEPLEQLPAEWIKMQTLAAEARSKVLIKLPDDLILEPMNKNGGPCKLAMLNAQAMAEISGADAAIGHTYSAWRNKKNEMTAEDFVNMMPNEYSISVLTVTPEQLKLIVDEQKSYLNHSFGLDKLPTKPIKLAVDSYDVTGHDGTFPQLHMIAGSDDISRVDTQYNIREALQKLLMRLYPAE